MDVVKDAVADAEGPLQGEVPQAFQAPDCGEAGIGQVAAAVELHFVQPSKHTQLGIDLQCVGIALSADEHASSSLD